MLQALRDAVTQKQSYLTQWFRTEKTASFFLVFLGEDGEQPVNFHLTLA